MAAMLQISANSSSADPEGKAGAGVSPAPLKEPGKVSSRDSPGLRWAGGGRLAGEWCPQGSQVKVPLHSPWGFAITASACPPHHTSHSCWNALTGPTLDPYSGAKQGSLQRPWPPWLPLSPCPHLPQPSPASLPPPSSQQHLGELEECGQGAGAHSAPSPRAFPGAQACPRPEQEQTDVPEPVRVSPSPASPHRCQGHTQLLGHFSRLLNLLSPCHPRASAPRTSALTSSSAHAASWEPAGPRRARPGHQYHCQRSS